MREIKFRAYEEQTKTMFYDLDYITGSGLGAFCKRPLIRPVLMQYTGFNDAKDNKIYEGDILVDYANYIGDDPEDSINLLTVESIDGCFVVNWGRTIYDAVDIDRGEIEVIGNIYENPELLEGQNE